MRNMTDCRRPRACGHHHLLRCDGRVFRWNKNRRSIENFGQVSGICVAVSSAPFLTEFPEFTQSARRTLCPLCSLCLAVEFGTARVPFFDEVVEGDFPRPKNKNHQPDREKYERIRIVELRRVREERGERGLPVPQLPLFPPLRFRVTFAQAEIYNYKCSLRDNLGMVGKVIVLP